MASETYSRGDFLVKRSTPVIDSGLDICPNNVGGHLMPIFYGNTLDATVTASKMERGGTTTTDFVPIKPGSIIGMAVRANTALATDMHVTFTAYNGTTSTGFSVTLNASGDQSGTTTQAKDTDTFSAGDIITVQAWSDSLTTRTFNIDLFVEM